MNLSLVTTFALALFIVGCQKQTPPATTEKQEAVVSAPTPATVPPDIAPIQAHDGPFGLKMGLSKGQIEAMGVRLSKSEDGFYFAKKLPKPHSGFENYLLVIGEKEGLCKIVGIGRSIKTGSFGTDLQSQFDSLEKQLKDVYGNNTRFDFVRKGSLWKEPQYWMMGLLKTDRTLMASWEASEGTVMKESISSIILDTSAENLESGSVGLTYQFSNFSACIESVKAKEKSAL